MKKSFLLLITFIIASININAQITKSSDFTDRGYFNRILNYHNNKNNLYSDVKSNGYQKLDSIIRPDYSKEELYYDDKGHNIQYLYNELHNTDKFKEEYFYDVNGNLISVNGYWWENPSNQYINEYIQEASYSGTLLSSVTQRNWENNQWRNSYKEEYTYNSYNNLTNTVSTLWDTISMQWVSYSRYDYSYDTNMNRSVRLYWVWDNDQWSNNEKTTYIYDTSGNMVLYTNYNWNNSTSTWLQSYKGEYTYDVLNRPILTILSGSETGDQWTNSRKIDYTYSYTCSQDSLILPINHEYYYDSFIDITAASFTMHLWDLNANDWYISYTKDKYFSGITFLSVSTDSIIFTLPESSSQTFDIKSSTDWTIMSDQNWLSLSNGEDQGETTITGSGNATITIILTANPSTMSRTAIVTISGIGVKSQVIAVTQEGVPTNNTDRREEVIFIYPNPSKEFIVFDLTNISESSIVELFDIQGKKVLEQMLSENKQISVSSLPKGLYLYKLYNRDIIYIGKLIIE